MRNWLVIAFSTLCCLTLHAQDVVHQYADTLDARELTGKADDSYLLALVQQQAVALKAREDSLHQLRLLTDTTTILPLHLGYADSLRIVEQVKRQGGTTILAGPLLYQPAETLHLPPLEWGEESAETCLSGDLSGLQEPGGLRARAAARRYLTTHAAALYRGMADPNAEAPSDWGKSETEKSEYELQVPQRSLVKDVEEEHRERMNAIRNKRNPWFKELTTLLQFTQNYASPNWHEGGNSAFAMYASVKGVIKYDDRKRLAWDNVLEWNEGLATTSSDSIHKFNTNEDLFRLYSKLGVKMSKKLYLSFSAEYRSQVLPTYKSNSKDWKTGFCTPIRFDLALGVDYKPVSGVSIVAAPAAYKLVYLNDTSRVNPSSFGVAEGEKASNEFGASVRVEWVWKPLREIALDTKFYAYTSYLRPMVELDLEVNCDFIINRFLTARVKLHPRYDTQRVMEGEEKAKMQFKELISIGFSHKFH